MRLNITSGVVRRAQKVVIYGPEGIGKSTLASKFPNPLFIDTENGTQHMDVRRVDAP
ncbi:MAG: AAA family ATPase, partial [Oscillibacter sp.]|nr:AAA family ATPase [Oscillibacter sp.]